MIRLKVTEDNINVKLKTESPLTFKVNEGIPIYPVEYTGDYEKTPTEEEQTLSTNGLMMTDDVTIHAIDSEYVGSDIPRRTALIRNGATVTAQEGYYSEETDTTIPDATMKGVINPYPETVGGSVDDNGLVGINYEIDDFAYPIYQEGYATPSDGVLMYNSGTLEYQLPTAVPYVNNENEEYFTEDNHRKWRIQPYVEVDESEGDTAGYMANGTHINGEYIERFAVPKNTTITPSSSAQTIGGANYMMEGAITVEPIPNNYGLITWNGSTLTVS